jgi:hypothetical protein
MRILASFFRRYTRRFPLIAALILLAALAACGSDRAENDYNITLNGHAVIWVGYASADEKLKGELDATVVCLRANGLRTRPGEPLVIVVDGTFNCNGVLARGCAQIGGSAIYITKEYLYTAVFAHEVVHWETGMGNEFHDTPQFEACCDRDQ